MKELYKASGVQFENLLVRTNGQLLLTASNKPDVWSFDPHSKFAKPEVVHAFDGATSTLGIAEYKPDVFAVVVGNYSGFDGVPGTFSVWSLDFTGKEVSVNEIASMPEASSLNGMDICENSTTLLIADSVLAGVWKLDVATGAHSLAITHPLFSNTTSPGKTVLAINGIACQDSRLYFSNSALNIFASMPLDKDYLSAGEVQVISHGKSTDLGYDDFDISWTGTVWMGTHMNDLTEIAPSGKRRTYTGFNSTCTGFPTAVALDKENLLYVVTAMGQILSVDRGAV